MLPVVNQTAPAIPKTWRKPNEVVSAGDAPQMEDKVRKIFRKIKRAVENKAVASIKMPLLLICSILFCSFIRVMRAAFRGSGLAEMCPANVQGWTRAR